MLVSHFIERTLYQEEKRILALQGKIRKAQQDVLTIEQRRVREWRREWNRWAFSILGAYSLLFLGLVIGLGLGVNLPYGVACDEEVLCSFIRIRDVEI